MRGNNDRIGSIRSNCLGRLNIINSINKQKDNNFRKNMDTSISSNQFSEFSSFSSYTQSQSFQQQNTQSCNQLNNHESESKKVQLKIAEREQFHQFQNQQQNNSQYDQSQANYQNSSIRQTNNHYQKSIKYFVLRIKPNNLQQEQTITEKCNDVLNNSEKDQDFGQHSQIQIDSQSHKQTQLQEVPQMTLKQAFQKRCPKLKEKLQNQRRQLFVKHNIPQTLFHQVGCLKHALNSNISGNDKSKRNNISRLKVSKICGDVQIMDGKTTRRQVFSYIETDRNQQNEPNISNQQIAKYSNPRKEQNKFHNKKVNASQFELSRESFSSSTALTHRNNKQQTSIKDKKDIQSNNIIPQNSSFYYEKNAKHRVPLQQKEMYKQTYIKWKQLPQNIQKSRINRMETQKKIRIQKVKMFSHNVRQTFKSMEKSLMMKP